MRFLESILFCALAFSSTLASPVPAQANGGDDSPTVVHPGGPADIIITSLNTLNSTNGSPPPASGPKPLAGTANLQLMLFNNISTGPVNAYVTGLDTSGRLVILQNNGQFYYPSAQQGNTSPQKVNADITIALSKYGTTKTVTLPNFLTSGRVWFAAGTLQFFTIWPTGAPGPSLVQPAPANPSDPNAGTKWGFVELTNNSGGIYANLSYIDFVSLILGISLKTTDGKTQSAAGLRPGSLATICNTMKYAQAYDGQPWGKLCQTDSAGNLLRVLGPSTWLSTAGNTFNNYWTDYVNKVWSQYTSNTLTVDTQGSAGKVACKVNTSIGNITCAGDNYSYGKPTDGDIFGCNSGPFAPLPNPNAVHLAVTARLCAAFNRGTLLLSGGNVQPSLPASSYYQQEPSNQWSRLLHALEIDGRGYAFPYDDVRPSGAPDQSGTLTAPNPQALTINVG